MDIAIGDFFYASWGYDQTNVDFFKVVGLTPKGVKIQHWASAPFGGRVMPGAGPRDGRVQTKVLRGDGSLAWKSYADLRRWDGMPKYQTGAGAGH